MIPSQRVINLMESLEDLLFFTSRNTNAGIDNIKLKHLLFFAVADINTTFYSEFQGILDQVGHYLGQFSAVRCYDAFRVTQSFRTA